MVNAKIREFENDIIAEREQMQENLKKESEDHE